MKNLNKFLVLGICLLLWSCGSDDDGNASNIEFQGYIWNKLNSDVFSYTQNGSGLTLNLKQNAVWLDAQQGGMFYTLIDGDFDFMATVKTTKQSDTSSPPDISFSFGGLIVRAPNTSQENYVHLVTGIGDVSEDSPYGYEYKATSDNNSEYEIVYDGSSEHDLRIVRSGNDFTFYERPAGSGAEVMWNEINTQSLALPSQVQLGFSIYTGSNPGSVVDLRTTFSNIQIIKAE